MNYVRVKSYAKINITLDITGVRGGFHMLDSVVASIDLYDLIAVKKRRDNAVTVTMHGEGCESLPYENNNAAKAAKVFVETFGTCGADITIWKNIPVGAGLGGSSADVAGVLNALAKLYGVCGKGQLKALADGLGSDCGYMLSGGFARISGRGDVVKPLECDLKLHIGLIVPKKGVFTAECYALCDKLNVRGVPTSERAESALLRGNAAELGESLSNGLAIPAARLNGDIASCMEDLRAFGPLGVNMTGSGSGVYAIFENDQFLRYAHSRYRGDNRFIMTKTVVPTKEDKDG